MATVRIALLNIRLVLRTKAALFFTFFFPLVFLFAYAGLFAHGNPQAVLYLFGPVVTLNIMGSGFWGLGLQSVAQRERGSLRRYRLAPIGAGTIISANLLANYLLNLPTAALLVLTAHIVFHMPLNISLFSLLVLVTVGNFAFSGFGLTIASIANTMQEAQIYNNLAWLTLLFLSGATIPLPLLPHWIQRVATFLPATYLVSAFQAVMVQAEPLARHAPELLALTVSGTFGLLFAWKLFRWEKEERIPPRRKAWALAFVFPFLLIGTWMNTLANPTAAWAGTYSLLDRGQARFNSTSSESPNRILEDFEKPGAAADLGRRWQLVSPRASAGNVGMRLSLTSPGAGRTQHALRVQPGTNGTGTSEETVSLRWPFTPANVDTLHGVEAWVRGDVKSIQIDLHVPGPTLDLAPRVTFSPSSDWQSVRLPFGRLAPPPGGESQEASWELDFTLTGPSDRFFMEIDEIRLY